MLMTLVYFILALFLLVIFHEYGHFLIARLCGVKVLRFSFGFGKVLARYRGKKGTEYVFSLLPLGGYVKMLDEEEDEVPPEEKQLAFNNKSLGARAAIVLAGPVFNFIFAFVALWLVLIIGRYSLTPLIGEVKPGTPAAVAGLKPTEQILSLNGTPINNWHDFQYAIMPFIGSSDSLQLTVKSPPENATRTVMLPLEAWHINSKKPDPLGELGIVPFIPAVPPIVGSIVKASPATGTNIQVGDRVLTFDGQRCTDWLDLVDYVRDNPNKTIQLTILRGHQQKNITMVIGNKDNQGFLGLRSKQVKWDKKWLKFDRLDPVTAIEVALKQTVQLTKSTFILLGRFVTGQLALDNISGPIGIAQGAGNSGRNGLTSYLSFLALISVSLGVLNLLPIPMLDGGHLLFYLFEAIKGRPLSIRTKTLSMYLGLMFLVLLTIVAFTNDISRLG